MDRDLQSAPDRVGKVYECNMAYAIRVSFAGLQPYEDQNKGQHIALQSTFAIFKSNSQQ